VGSRDEVGTVRPRWRAARRGGVLLAMTVALGAGVLAGCGEDGVTLPTERPSITLPTRSGATEQPTTEAPTETTAAPTETTAAPTETTEAPTETPTEEPTTPTPTEEPTTPTPTETSSEEAAGPEDETDEGVSPWWFVLLALAVLVGIIWWVMARSARSRKAEAELLAGLESRGRWAVDHGVGALIGAGDPAATQEAWSRLNATLVDMAGEVRTLAHSTPADQGSVVIALRDAVASLQGAAESHARARLAGDPSPTTAEAVFAARDRLSQALSALRPPPG
jgi:hypothetical protein